MVHSPVRTHNTAQQRFRLARDGVGESLLAALEQGRRMRVGVRVNANCAADSAVFSVTRRGKKKLVNLEVDPIVLETGV